jgi:hypothetical protein
LRKYIFSFDHMTSGFQCPSVYRQTRYTAKLPTAQKVAVKRGSTVYLNLHIDEQITIHKRKTTVNTKVSEFCYDMHFHYQLPLKKISKTFPTRIEIIHGSHSLYNVLTYA